MLPERKIRFFLFFLSFFFFGGIFLTFLVKPAKATCFVDGYCDVAGGEGSDCPDCDIGDPCTPGSCEALPQTTYCGGANASSPGLGNGCNDVGPWIYCYNPSCRVYQSGDIPTCLWYWSWTSCGAYDTCKGSPYLYAGQCGSSGCTIGGIYKTCCATDAGGNLTGLVDGNCSGGDFTGVCSAGSVAVQCGFEGKPACGTAACSAGAPTPTPGGPTPTPGQAYCPSGNPKPECQASGQCPIVGGLQWVCVDGCCGAPSNPQCGAPPDFPTYVEGCNQTTQGQNCTPGSGGFQASPGDDLKIKVKVTNRTSTCYWGVIAKIDFSSLGQSVDYTGASFGCNNPPKPENNNIWSCNLALWDPANPVACEQQWGGFVPGQTKTAEVYVKVKSTATGTFTLRDWAEKNGTCIYPACCCAPESSGCLPMGPGGTGNATVCKVNVERTSLNDWGRLWPCSYTFGSANQDFSFYSNPFSVTVPPTPTPTPTPTPLPAWFQTRGGDVHGNGDVGTWIPSTCNLPTCNPYFSLDPAGVASTGRFSGFRGNIAGKMSSPPPGWQVEDTVGEKIIGFGTNQVIYGYDYFDGKISSPSVLSVTPGGGELNNLNGFYKVEGIGDLNIRNNFGVSSTKKIVILVPRNLRVDNQITVDVGGFLAFIVKGDIIVDKNLGMNPQANPASGKNLEGVFIADGFIRTIPAGETASSDKKFLGAGIFVADANLDDTGGFDLRRDLGSTGSFNNTNTPAEYFEFRPDFLVNFPPELGSKRMVWREVAP